MEYLFWVSVSIILFTYLGYPLFLLVLSKVRPRPVRKEAMFGHTVSVVIAARNEEEKIVPRLRNLLEQNYPSHLIEVIVVSDGSTDGTNEAVKDFSRALQTRALKGPRIKLISYHGSRGKPHALNGGVRESTGEFIVFADCRQRFECDAIQNLINNFADPEVGCVSGELIFYKDSESGIRAEMGAYWSYEKFIRKKESATGSVVGATGAIYAIRRELYKEIPEETILDDVLVPLQVVFQGKRVVFESEAVAYDEISSDVKQEWNRKVRTLSGNWQLVGLKPTITLPWKNPVWLRFFSHKVLRLLIPVFLITAFLSSALQDSPFFLFVTWLQLGFYGAVAVAGAVPMTRQIRWMNLMYFFMVLNMAASMGFLVWVRGRCGAVWKPDVAGVKSAQR